MSTTVGK